MSARLTPWRALLALSTLLFVLPRVLGASVPLERQSALADFARLQDGTVAAGRRLDNFAGEGVGQSLSPYVARRDGEQQDLAQWASGVLLDDEQAKNPQALAVGSPLSVSAPSGILPAKSLLPDSGELETSARKDQEPADSADDASFHRKVRVTETEGTRSKTENAGAEKSGIRGDDSTTQAVLALLETERENTMTEKNEIGRDDTQTALTLPKSGREEVVTESNEIRRDDSTTQSLIALAESERENERENAGTENKEIRGDDQTKQALVALLGSEREGEGIESDDDEGLIRVEAATDPAKTAQDDKQTTNGALAPQQPTENLKKNRPDVALEVERVWHKNSQLLKMANYWKSRAKDAERSLRSLQVDAARIRVAADQERVMSRKAIGLKQSEIDALLQQRSADSHHKKVVSDQSRLLKEMLKEDKRLLKEMKKSVDGPDIRAWLRRRMERIANYLDSQEGEGAGDYWERIHEEGLRELSEAEHKVEKGIGILIPVDYGPFGGSVSTLMLVGIPPVVALVALLFFTKKMPMSRYVLMGNAVLVIFVLSMCMTGILLGDDPLRSLYFTSKEYFVGTNWVLAVWYILFCSILGATACRSRQDRDTAILAVELLLYLLVGWHYHSNVWRPAMLGIGITTNRLMYVLYLAIFSVMIFVTARELEHPQARKESPGSNGDLDIEPGYPFLATLSGELSGGVDKTE